MTFGAVSNRTYTLQHAERVSGGSWSKLMDFPARGATRVEAVFDPAFAPARYYRVVTPRQP